MRTFIADSDTFHQVNLHQKGFAPEAGVQSHSSLPKPASFEKAEKFDSDEVKSKEDPEGAAKDGSSSSRLFSWKTKLLREHVRTVGLYNIWHGIRTSINMAMLKFMFHAVVTVPTFCKYNVSSLQYSNI